MITSRSLSQIVIGFGVVAVANWILLGPLFGAPLPKLEWIAIAVIAFFVGCMLVGRGTRLAIKERRKKRPVVAEQDHTMDWITRP